MVTTIIATYETATQRIGLLFSHRNFAPNEMSLFSVAFLKKLALLQFEATNR